MSDLQFALVVLCAVVALACLLFLVWKDND